MSQTSLNNFNHPSWRRVISQLREIFNDLHDQVESNRDDDKCKNEQRNLSEICLDASQKYIYVIENELKLIGETNEEEINIKESLKLLLKVWKLSQIIFIKSSPSGALLIDLQDWYKSTNNIDPMVQELFSINSSDMDQLYRDQNYWPLVLISVAQGRIDTARHLLSFHPSKSQSIFRSIDEQLRTMPNFSSLSHLSLFEFKAKWEYWQKKCIKILTNESFDCEETGSLEIICKMLCADEATFLDLKPIFNNWYYMLISLISYSNPTFNISDLHLHLASKTCMKRFEGELEEFDAIIHNIFDFDVEVVIKDCVQLFSNNLFSAHLLDILYLNGKLQLNKHEFTISAGGSLSNNLKNNGGLSTNLENANLIHEQNLIEYAVQLLNTSWSTESISMNQTAFDYLIKCKNTDATSGMELIEIYMEKYPLTYVSELDANKLFNMAFKYGLHDLAFSIGRVMQTRAFKRGFYGTALSWNVRIKDMAFGTFLAEKILEEFFLTDNINLIDLTQNLSKEIIYCDRLIFLSKFREFYKLTKLDSGAKSKQQQQTAATLIIQLLEAPKLIPFKYNKRILFELRSFVKENVFSEEQLFSLLRIIQSNENRRDIFKEGKRFNLSSLNQSTENDIVYQIDENMQEVIDLEPKARNQIEIESKFDQKTWNEFLNDISLKLADCFLNNSVEILSN